jgi:RNA polymerase sigma factor (sigma-70 family)
MDVPAAEEIVQDAFIALHRAWHRLGDAERALRYLYHSVINRSRSMSRGRSYALDWPPGARLERDVGDVKGRSTVMAALQRLPARQREALVLRYYAGLAEGDAAAAMGTSADAVRSHLDRGMAALQGILGPRGPLAGGSSGAKHGGGP